MKENDGKQPETQELKLTPVGVVKWILMLVTILFLAYMIFKFLIPKVAYS